MYDFETFVHRAKPAPNTPWITIQTRGYMSFNLGAYELLDKPDAVELMYDKKHKVIGIRKVDPDAKSAYLVRKQSDSNTFIIASRAFTRFFGIEIASTRRHKVKLEEDTVIIDLTQEGEPVNAPRTKNQITAT